MIKDNKFSIEDIALFLKETGFIFQGSKIYNGLANSWDYGPLGVILKHKIKQAWWKHFIKNNPYNCPIDTGILLNSQVWKASGHIDSFNDPLVDCKECKSRFRADHLVQYYFPNVSCEHWNNNDFDAFLFAKKAEITCLKCHKANFTKVRNFQLMFATNYGSTTETASKLYLRPETAQGIFINFNNIVKYYNKKLPFGIGQIGKSFRNEITPGNYIFRTLEFEQMELEFFFNPNDSQDWFNYWVLETSKFLTTIGISKENYRFYEHSKEELSHYSLATTDIQYHFPFGWKELCGIANRSSYDLEQHSKFSNKKLMIKDHLNNDKLFFPHVIEPSIGLERLLLAIICDNLKKEQHDGKEKIILTLPANLVIYHVVVTTVNKNKLTEKGQEVFQLLQSSALDVVYEAKSSIGKVYSYHDSIGTLYCITVDYQTMIDETITVRHRDTRKQIRVKIKALKHYLYQELNFFG